MKNSYTPALVVSNKSITKDVFELVLQGNFKADPGQFFMLKTSAENCFLPRPISVCDIRANNLVLLYRVVGKGSLYLSKLNVGDSLSLLGPLGKGFQIPDKGSVAIVGGGIGIAPLLYLLKNIKTKPDVFLGFNDAPYYTAEFRLYAESLYLSSDKGIMARKGNIIESFGNRYYDHVFCCGPMPMMKALKSLMDKNCNLQVSLEAHMACGIGACLGCAFSTTNGIKRVCKDGPVFNAQEVLFDA